jgi:hypothetical protein
MKRTSEIEVWRTKIRTKHLKTPGDGCLLNDLVKVFSKGGKSDPRVHHRLMTGLTEKHGFRIVTKDGRVIVVRTR